MIRPQIQDVEKRTFLFGGSIAQLNVQIVCSEDGFFNSVSSCSLKLLECADGELLSSMWSTWVSMISFCPLIHVSRKHKIAPSSLVTFSCKVSQKFGEQHLHRHWEIKRFSDRTSWKNCRLRKVYQKLFFNFFYFTYQLYGATFKMTKM